MKTLAILFLAGLCVMFAGCKSAPVPVLEPILSRDDAAPSIFLSGDAPPPPCDPCETNDFQMPAWSPQLWPIDALAWRISMIVRTNGDVIYIGANWIVASNKLYLPPGTFVQHTNLAGDWRVTIAATNLQSGEKYRLFSYPDPGPSWPNGYVPYVPWTASSDTEEHSQTVNITTPNRFFYVRQE